LPLGAGRLEKQHIVVRYFCYHRTRPLNETILPDQGSDVADAGGRDHSFAGHRFDGSRAGRASREEVE